MVRFNRDIGSKLVVISIPVLIIAIVYVGYTYILQPNLQVPVVTDTTQVDSVYASNQEDASEGKPLGIVRDTPSDTVVKVDVDGQVKKPGIVELTGADLRISDAIGAAGGLLPEADTSQINLAAKVSDAQKIYIPKLGEQQQSAPLDTTQTQAGFSESQVSAKVNINTASASDLEKLPGIGKQTAQLIVKSREQHKFKRIEDLMKISGIGQKKFDKVRDYICV